MIDEQVCGDADDLAAGSIPRDGGPPPHLGSVTPWFVVLAFGVTMDRAYIAVEERMLAETFGQAWIDYRAHVGRRIAGL